MRRDSFFHKLCDEFYKLCDECDNRRCSCPCCSNTTDYIEKDVYLKDNIPKPCVINIHEATNQNCNFRLPFWLGKHLQLILMNIKPKEDVGLKVYPNMDCFICIEKGEGLIIMGNSKNNLWFRKKLYPGCAALVPAGTWHNIINIGCTPLKLYSIYAPPDYPHGRIQRNGKQDNANHNYW